MDLDRLAVRLRPRSDWEALDLGYAMIRSWWRSVYAAWLPFALPAAAASILLFGGWGFLIFWWILPIFESTTLTVLSRTVFGDAPPLGQVLREAPRNWRRFLADATWRRFDTRRSFHHPVTLLEGSTGSERRARIQVLRQGTSDAAAWLSFAFFFFALGLTVATVSALVMLTPPWLGIDWQLIDTQMDAGEAPWAWKGLFLLWALAILLLDPIYVACGFCLYLSRRTELEGWDLEIAFRSLARRLRQSKVRNERGRSAALWLSVGLLTLLALLPTPVEAQDETAPEIQANTQAEARAPESRPSQVIKEVMERDELKRKVEEERWQLRSDLDWLDFLDDQDEQPATFGGDFAGMMVAFGAKLLEILLWLGLALVLFLMVREIWRGTPKIQRPKEKKVVAPERIVGLDVRRESLPPDVAAASAELWRTGQHVEALGLLYRGALSRLHGEGLELRESFTELDCLVAARRFLTTERSQFFGTLTAAWQTAAYAHRLPEDSQAETLIAGWKRIFDSTPEPAP